MTSRGPYRGWTDLHKTSLGMNVAALTLGVVSGEQTHSAFSLTSTEHPCLDVQASVDSVREDTSTFCRFVGENKMFPCLTNLNCQKSWRTT